MILPVISLPYKNVKPLTYALWRATVLEHLRSPILPDVSENDYPTVDFKRIYKAVPNPEEGAKTVRAVYTFTKAEFQRFGK